MKKQILNFALVATVIGSIAAGCSSEKKAGGTDSTSVKDSSGTMSAPAMKDSTIKDTTKKDTTKTPPKM